MQIKRTSKRRNTVTLVLDEASAATMILAAHIKALEDHRIDEANKLMRDYHELRRVFPVDSRV